MNRDELLGALEIKNALLECVDVLNSKEPGTVRLNRLLSTIGSFYGADRAYIFEFDRAATYMTNTYEWCQNGIAPMIDRLQKIKLDRIRGWLALLQEQDEYYLASVEELREREPEVYRNLASLGVSSMMLMPLHSDEKIVGFIGVENMSLHVDVVELIHSIASFVINEMERIRYIERLENVSYRDSLTGFKNRRAYNEEVRLLEEDTRRGKRSLGVVYADVNGLKTTNDKEGHEAGDLLIAGIAKLLRLVFADADIFRMGGDEFLVFDFGETQNQFNKKVAELASYWSDDRSASVGSFWIPVAENIEQAIAQADQKMYHEKTLYYEQRFKDRRKNRPDGTQIQINVANDVAEYLPGGFFTYHADGDQKLLFFNKQILELYGCANANEFRELTGNSFRGMVHPDDYERIQREIDDQIGKENDIDYVSYRIKRKDGTIVCVHDWGRFVHSDKYGDIFYVFESTGEKSGSV